MVNCVGLKKNHTCDLFPLILFAVEERRKTPRGVRELHGALLRQLRRAAASLLPQLRRGMVSRGPGRAPPESLRSALEFFLLREEKRGVRYHEYIFSWC